MDTTTINLLSLINAPLKKVAGTGGGEYHGPCPLCGGTDRFIVQPSNGRWSCRQCSPKWNDAIAFVMRRDNVSFKEAVESLSLSLPERQQRATHHRPTLPPPPVNAGNLREDYACFHDGWQANAHEFVGKCFDRLWSSEGERALNYLKDRHMTESIIGAAGLGYNDQEIRAYWGDVEVWLPRGIVIPWEYAGQIWTVNIRRPNGDIRGDKGLRYIQAKGGANGLYGADFIYPDCGVMIVEGEFDSLVLRSAFRPNPNFGRMVFVATGSSVGARLLRWVTLLSMSDGVLMAFDADEAGDKASEWWSMALHKKTRRTRPNGAKDITDMVSAGINLYEWLDEVL